MPTGTAPARRSTALLATAGRPADAVRPVEMRVRRVSRRGTPKGSRARGRHAALQAPDRDRWARRRYEPRSQRRPWRNTRVVERGHKGTTTFTWLILDVSDRAVVEEQPHHMRSDEATPTTAGVLVREVMAAARSYRGPHRCSPCPRRREAHLMKCPPLADEICLSPRKRTCERRYRRDVDDSLGFAVPRMEVRDAVLPAVDVDDDAVEGSDPGHRANIPTASDTGPCPVE